MGRATVASREEMDRLPRAGTSKDDGLMANEECPREVEADAELDEARLEKIQRLRAAIADGTYSVSAEALAEKMIEHMSEAGGPALEKDASE
jgi:flagellar biosynthesis anti-sigma factor FlgM